ncbi:MAG: type II toxin-antitoxin system RelE/ParE family toxin [Burkholderiales bacterium]
MAQIILSAKLQDDFDRIIDLLLTHEPEIAADRIDTIITALDVLVTSPLIGWPAENSKRELVMAKGASGYAALYRFVPELDTVFVLAVRSQRELDHAN